MKKPTQKLNVTHSKRRDANFKGNRIEIKALKEEMEQKKMYIQKKDVRLPYKLCKKGQTISGNF